MNNFWTETSSKGDMWIRAQRTTRMEYSNNENYQVEMFSNFPTRSYNEG